MLDAHLGELTGAMTGSADPIVFQFEADPIVFQFEAGPVVVWFKTGWLRVHFDNNRNYVIEIW